MLTACPSFRHPVWLQSDKEKKRKEKDKKRKDKKRRRKEAEVRASHLLQCNPTHGRRCSPPFAAAHAAGPLNSHAWRHAWTRPHVHACRRACLRLCTHAHACPRTHTQEEEGSGREEGKRHRKDKKVMPGRDGIKFGCLHGFTSHRLLSTHTDGASDARLPALHT